MRPFILIIGPCAAESELQMQDLAVALRDHIPSARTLLRAGVWKPRTLPDNFSGVGQIGLTWLVQSASLLNVPPITEVGQPEHLLQAYNAGLRHFWIGSRTAGDPFALTALADTARDLGAPSMTFYVKNPLSSDLSLWYGAITRLQKTGAQVHAIHRGYAFPDGSTTGYRNIPRYSAVLELRKRFPAIQVLTDVSHIAGDASKVANVAMEAINHGADGLMIEVHPHPAEALTDARQQISPDTFKSLLIDLPVTAPPLSPAAELDELRMQIDETDDALWALVTKRMQIAQAIGDYKRTHHMQPYQPQRYNQVLQRRKDWATAHGIAHQTVQRIVDALHDESVARQQAIQTNTN